MLNLMHFLPLNKLTIFAALLSISFLSYSKTLYVSADAMVDVKNGKLVKSPVLVIENDTIVKIVKQGKVDIPVEADHLDLQGQTLLPGFMDMHVHLTSDPTKHGYKRLSSSIPRQALFGVTSAKKTLMAGFTTVRNLGATGYADIALRDAINDGDVIGPRMFVAGPSLSITGGHCDNNLLPPEFKVTATGVANGPWAVRQKVRENIKYGADVIKFCATGGVLSKGTKVGAQQFSQEEMNAIVSEANLRGLVSAAHAHGTEGIKAAIKAGVTTVEHASFLDKEAIKLAKKYGTYFSMDIYTTEYILSEGEKAGILQESLDKERVVGGKQRESFRQAVKAGVKMVFGSDAGVYPHGDNGQQFSRMVQFGMTPMQAIQAGTINPATMLKIDGKLGSLSEGKLADIVAVKGNPLEDMLLLADVSVVIKDGKIVKQ